MISIEEKVEEYYKSLLDTLSVRHYSKTESINDSIGNALRSADSKSGGSGNNFPDIQLYLEDKFGRRIPVMIEAKGSKNKLIKYNKDGKIEQITYWDTDSKEGSKNPHKQGDPKYTTIQQFAVNGALHYGLAILENSDYQEVIVVGINGTTLDSDGNVSDPECEAYYVSEKNHSIPKKIERISAKDWSLFKAENISQLFSICDKLNLTEKELEALALKTEATLEEKIKAIHQSLYDDVRLKTALSTNEKLYLFCGLIMAGLKTNGIHSLEASELFSNNNDYNNDGTKILNHIESFLYTKNCTTQKVNMIKGLLEGVFSKQILWVPRNGESLLKVLFKQVKTNIIPCLESNFHLDFTGRILNSLNDWVSIDNDAANDVVLTPRYITKFMTKLCRVDMDSVVLDKTMGSGGFLVSAMDEMIKDAQNKIVDESELAAKIKNIKEHQLLGVEILGNIYILAVLNMILMGDGSSQIFNGDSHELVLPEDFKPSRVLLNPPYSAEAKGMIFLEEAMNQMSDGYASIIIQDSAGNGQGIPCTKRILENNTLLASLKMPQGLFGNKASVSVCIFLFKVGRPHEADDIVTFIDFSEDGYSRQNRKKSTQEVNLRNTDHAIERYDEVLAIVLGKKPKTHYYSEANGKVIRDCISLNGDDWNFNSHLSVDSIPSQEDFKGVIGCYLGWKVSRLMEAA